MVVLHLIDDGGFNSVLRDLAAGWKNETIRLEVVALRNDTGLSACMAPFGVPTFFISMRRFTAMPAAVLRLARLIRSRRPDIVHVHLVWPSLIGGMVGRLLGIPVVMTRHHADAAIRSGSIMAPRIDALTARYLVDRTIAVSDAVKDVMVRSDGVDAARINVVSNGFDLARIRADDARAQAFRANVGGSPIFGTVARLDALKGHDVLLEAFARADAGPDKRLVIIGAGDATPLREHAQRLGVADHCVFAGYRTDVYDVMRACDVIVHPSLSEAQSSTIIEAMLLGIPVVATSVGDAERMIVDRETGWLVPAGDAAALAEAMTAAAHALPATDLVNAARARVAHMYPLDRMVEAYELEYKGVMELN